MPARTITLQRDGTCTECGVTLPAGAQARYYSKEKMYCVGEHAGDGAAPPDPGVPYDDNFPPAEPDTQVTGWNYEKKDRLMCRESCAKSAVAIFAASIQAGIYKSHPDVSAVTAYAAALETWCLESLD